MNTGELNKRLKQLKVEDFIWIIYIGIIFFSLYANTFERKYFLYNDHKSKETYRKIMIGIFIILVIVYAYFFKDSIEDIKSLKINDTQKKKDLTKFSLLGSFLILVSGIIFLYIAIEDEDIDVELAFN